MVQGVERRRHRRIYFTVEDGIFAVIELPFWDDASISTNLLSLSEGGVSFICHKEHGDLEPGQNLMLSRVFEPEELSFLHQVPMQVRHTINEPDMPHMVVGCQFLDISPDHKARIADYIARQLDT